MPCLYFFIFVGFHWNLKKNKICQCFTWGNALRSACTRGTTPHYGVTYTKPNLAFSGLDMATKRAHSRRWTCVQVLVHSGCPVVSTPESGLPTHNLQCKGSQALCSSSSRHSPSITSHPSFSHPCIIWQDVVIYELPPLRRGLHNFSSINKRVTWLFIHPWARLCCCSQNSDG
jgi:hypothetical protein